MLVGQVVERVGRDATVSVHCHNDLGLATANTLAAVQAGARQVEVTINGLGERAGNASLEEVVMALRTRPTQFPDLGSGVQTEQITAASRLVSYLTGFAVQPNKAVVGGNAFAHESGIHQDGVIKNPLTYEIMTPQSVGLSGSQLTIGKLSGRRGLQGKLRELGHDLEGEALDSVYRQAISLADAKKEVTDADLLALVEARTSEVPASIALEGWSVTSSHGGNATGTVSLSIGGDVRSAESTGNGPVNALFSAVDKAIQPVLGWRPVLTEYEIKAVSAGEDAQGQVLVRCRRSSDEGPGALIVSGHGLSTNIIEASLEAYLVGTNKLHGAEINGVDAAFVTRARTEDLLEPRPREHRTRPTTYRLAAIPGDGVGPDVVAAARRVLEVVGAADGFGIDWTELTVGGAGIDAYGVAIRPDDVEACAASDAVLLGAVGGPDVGRSPLERPPGAGPVRPPRRARPVRQPAPGQRPSDARPGLAAPRRSCSGASTCSSSASSPGGSTSVRGPRPAARPAPAPRATRCPTPSTRSPGWSASRSSWHGAAAGR